MALVKAKVWEQIVRAVRTRELTLDTFRVAELIRFRSAKSASGFCFSLHPITLWPDHPIEQRPELASRAFVSVLFVSLLAEAGDQSCEE